MVDDDEPRNILKDATWYKSFIAREAHKPTMARRVQTRSNTLIPSVLRRTEGLYMVEVGIIPVENEPCHRHEFIPS